MSGNLTSVQHGNRVLGLGQLKQLELVVARARDDALVLKDHDQRLERLVAVNDKLVQPFGEVLLVFFDPRVECGVIGSLPLGYLARLWRRVDDPFLGAVVVFLVSVVGVGQVVVVVVVAGGSDNKSRRRAICSRLINVHQVMIDQFGLRWRYRRRRLFHFHVHYAAGCWWCLE
jgi:hypothetical protein